MKNNVEVSIAMKDLEREQMLCQVIVERDAIIMALSEQIQALKTQISELESGKEIA